MRSYTLLLVSTNADLAGAPIHVRELALQLIRTCPWIKIVAVFGEEGAVSRELRAAGIKAFVVPQIRSAISPLRDLAACHLLARIARRERVDLIHAHSTKAGFVARLCGAALRIPVMFTVHGWGFGPGRPSLQAAVVTCMERLVKPFTASYVIVSNADAASGRQTLKLSPARYAVVENGLPDSDWRAAPENSREMVMVARVTHAKNHQTAIQAFAGLKGDVRFKLLGAQTDEAPFRQKAIAWAGSAASRLRLRGVRNDIDRRLAKAGIFVLSSRFEGMPLSIIEAMRAGLPVIATDVGGVAEVVVHGETGFLVPADDVAALRAAMQRLLDDSALRKRFGDAGRARYEAKFSVDVMADKTIFQYERLLGARQGELARPSTIGAFVPG